jgi:hypothetical protein
MRGCYANGQQRERLGEKACDCCEPRERDVRQKDKSHPSYLATIASK